MKTKICKKKQSNYFLLVGYYDKCIDPINCASYKKKCLDCLWSGWGI